jgi:hypothetical protein
MYLIINYFSGLFDPFFHFFSDLRPLNAVWPLCAMRDDAC